MRARHDGAHTCEHCGEPVVRLQADGARRVSKWLHTPNRLPCINQLTRQPTGTEARAREIPAARERSPIPSLPRRIR